MKLHQQQHGAVSLLKPEGPLAEPDLAEFSRTLRTLIGGKLGRVVLRSLSRPFVDSGGLEHCSTSPTDWDKAANASSFARLTKTISAVLELTEIDSHFELFEDVNSAVRSFL